MIPPGGFEIDRNIWGNDGSERVLTETDVSPARRSTSGGRPNRCRGGRAGAGRDDHHRITIDERGGIYVIDAEGRLRLHRYDEAKKSWSIAGRIIDTGWSRFNLIVGAGPGVVMGRTSDGELLRFRLDTASQRWMVREQRVGTGGWNAFTGGIFSPGGDILLGIEADGDLKQYWFRESDGKWEVEYRHAGVGWGMYPTVMSTTDSCRLSAPTPPSVSDLAVTPRTPVSLIQSAPVAGAGLGTIDFAFTDNIGRILYGKISDPNYLSDPVWTAISGDDQFTGAPIVTSDAAGAVRVLAHNTEGGLWSRKQETATSPAWLAWTDSGGEFTADPAVVRFSDGAIAAFAVDADGSVWSTTQETTGGELLPWRELGGEGLAGPITVAATGDRSVLLLAADATGTLHNATYSDGVLPAWGDLSGATIAGRVSVVMMPGRKPRLFARTSEGKIVMRDAGAGGQFAGPWSPVGDQVVAGAPSAILDPVVGKVYVVARGTDAAASGEQGPSVRFAATALPAPPPAR